MYISNHCSHWQWLISYVAISAPEQTVFWRRRGDFWSFTVPHFSPPCVNLLKRVCIKIEEEKNESTKMENVISRTLLVIPSYLDKTGLEEKDEVGGLQRPQAAALSVHLWMCMEILWTSYLSLLVALQSTVGGHRTRSQSGEDPHHNNMIPLNWSTVYFLNIWSN